jgi:hypothetical protein
MKYKINLKSYYTEEIKKAKFIFNDENGLYEYFINNKPVISIKSWNYEFEFNNGISKDEIPELIKAMKDISQYYLIEEIEDKEVKE